MGIFDALKKPFNKNETPAEAESRKRREAEQKKAQDARDAETRKAEEKRRETKGYESDYGKKLGQFSDMFLKKKK